MSEPAEKVVPAPPYEANDYGASYGWRLPPSRDPPFWWLFDTFIWTILLGGMIALTILVVGYPHA